MLLKSHPRPFSIFVPILLCTALLAGCNLPGNIPATSTELPSPTPQPPQDTPSQAPPTATLEPTLTSTPPADSIVFSTGATAGVVTGTLQAGQSRSYTLAASQNQPMILILDSTYGDYFLGVNRPDGASLLDPANKWNRWQWILPSTGTYTVQVFASTRSESYTLTAKVAQLVSFGSGSNTITLPGSTVNGYVVSYAFYCTSGQTMSTSLNVPATTAHLDVFGIASGPLLNASSMANSWSGVLPSTQNYIVEVIPNNGQVVGYSLTVSCH